MPGRKFINRKSIFAVLLILLFSGIIIFNYRPKIDSKNDKYVILDKKLLNGEFSRAIKSGNLSVDYNEKQSVNDLKKLKLNTINVPVKVDIASIDSDSMSIDTKSMDKAKKTIKKLKAMHINVILEAYPWIADGTLYETKLKPKNVSKFFYNWKNRVMAPIIKEIAVPLKVNAVCIASNFDMLEPYENNWVDIAKYVKNNYKGLITYKTNWWYTAQWDKATDMNFQKKLKNKVFSKVDFISIAAYFELSDKPTNSVKQLKQDLTSSSIYKRKQNIVGEITQMHKAFNKPVYFGELGFPRRNYAAKEPWNSEASRVENGSEQARCFNAYNQVFRQNWFLGFSIFAIGENSADKNYYPSKQSFIEIASWN